MQLLKHLVGFLSLKSDFSKNTIRLVSGTTIAQAISLLTAPILARIYSPKDYGLLGLYMVVSTLAGTLSTFQYNNAIIIAEDEEEAKNVLKLSMIINVGISFLSTLVIMFTSGEICKFYNAPDLRKWLFFIPVSIFFAGVNLIMSSWGIRKKEFRVIAGNRVYISLLSPLLSISIGYFVAGPLGLFVGFLIGQLVPTLRMVYLFYYKYELDFAINLANLKKVSKKFRNFPKYSLPADFINNFSNQMPVMILSVIGGTGVVGWYGMAVRMMVLPSTLIANSIGEVFRQRAAKDYLTEGSCRPIFLKVFKILLVVSILPFTLLIYFGPELFSFLFGAKWIGAGEIVSIVGVLYLFKFVVSPLSYVSYIT